MHLINKTMKFMKLQISNLKISIVEFRDDCFWNFAEQSRVLIVILCVC